MPTTMSDLIEQDSQTEETDYKPFLPQVLRFTGVAFLIWTVCGTILAMLQAHWLDALWSTDGFEDSEAAIERLESLWPWFKITDTVGMLVVTIGVAAAVSAVRKRSVVQAALIAGVCLLVGSLGVMLKLYFTEITDPEGSRFYWDLKSYLMMAGLTATLLSAAMLTNWRWRGLFVGGYLVHVGAFLWLDNLPQDTFETITSRFLAGSAFDLVGAGFFLVGLVMSAKTLPDRSTESAREGVPDGRAMRGLSKAIGLRIGLSIGGVVLLFLLMLSKSFALIPLFIWVFAGIALATSCYLAWALVAYLSLPKSFRNGTALVVALVGLAVATVIEVVSAMNAAEMFSLVAKARASTSYWGVPGLSRIEDLQESLVQYRRFAVIFGVASYIAVAYALLSTASRLGDLVAVAKARLVMILVGTGAVGAVVLESVISTANRIDPLIFLAGAALLLCVAIATLTALFQLLSALANSLDNLEESEFAQD